MRRFEGVEWRRIACLVVFALMLGGVTADPPPVKRGKGGGWVVLPQVHKRATFMHHATVADVRGGIFLELDRSMHGAVATVSAGGVPAIVQVQNGLFLSPQFLDAVTKTGATEVGVNFYKHSAGLLEVRLVRFAGSWLVLVR